MTTITREQQKQILIDTANHVISRDNTSPYSENLRELARIALASLTAEPVAYNQVQRDMMKDIIVRKLGSNLLGHKLMMADIHAVTMALIQAGFRTAPPASERERIRREHAEWSDKTFGDVGPVGPLKHLSKEALEAAAEPGDLSEWADMQFLLWDAQRRAGISDGEITAAMEEKLKVNMARQWPEPKDGEPRLHIKEQPVPVAPEECPAELPYAQVKAAADLYALCWQSGEVVTYTPDPEKVTIWLNNYSGTCVQEYVRIERYQEAVIGNSPVTQDGWISCSERMPNDKQYVWCWGKSYGWTECDTFEGYYDWSRNKWWAVTDDGEEPASKVTHWMPLPEPPQEEVK